MVIKISNFKLGIGLPDNQHFANWKFVDSFMVMNSPFVCKMLRNNRWTTDIDEMRNEIVRKGLAEGCSHIVMLDTDGIYPADTLQKLLSHKNPIVSSIPHR